MTHPLSDEAEFIMMDHDAPGCPTATEKLGSKRCPWILGLAGRPGTRKWKGLGGCGVVPWGKAARRIGVKPVTKENGKVGRVQNTGRGGAGYMLQRVSVFVSAEFARLGA